MALGSKKVTGGYEMSLSSLKAKAKQASGEQLEGLKKKGYLIEGPFSISEVEGRSILRLKDSMYTKTPMVPFGFINDQWIALKKKIRTGDRIYEVDNINKAKTNRERACIIIRGGRVIGKISYMVAPDAKGNF